MPPDPDLALKIAAMIDHICTFEIQKAVEQNVLPEELVKNQLFHLGVGWGIALACRQFALQHDQITADLAEVKADLQKNAAKN